MLFHKVDKRYCRRIPTQALVYNHTHIHPSIYPSGVSVWHKQNKKTEEFPFLLTLFTQWRLGYKNEKCRWITFGALSTCCSNIYGTTLWILFLYDSKFLLMSHCAAPEHASHDRRDLFTLTCINRNNSHGSYITHHSYGLLYISTWRVSANTYFTKIKWISRFCSHRFQCWWGFFQIWTSFSEEVNTIFGH